jgi:hypothetical protein
MVWPFTPSKSDDSKDVLANLDPQLRDFLEKESPLKYNPKPIQPSAPTDTPSQPSSQPPATSTTSTEPLNQTSPSESDPPAPPPVPSASAYPDGRYAHLWSTYTPQADIDSEGKSSNEKVSDMLAAYKGRKGRIGEAALENCALEQWAQHECTVKGSWQQRMTMCRDETRALDRCYTMNTRFLKALGYLSVGGRTEQEEERVQMHADRLYGRMLELEREERLAREEGREVRSDGKGLGLNGADVDVLMGKEGRVESQELEDMLSKMKPSVRDSYKKKLELASPLEREVEMRAIAQEVKAGRDVQQYLDEVKRQDKENRERKTEKKQIVETKAGVLGTDGKALEGKQNAEGRFWGLFGR